LVWRIAVSISHGSFGGIFYLTGYGGLLRRGLSRLAQQRQRLGVARVALEDGTHLPDCLVALARSQQERGQVDAERDVVGHCLDGFAQARQHGGFGFHAAFRSCQRRFGFIVYPNSKRSAAYRVPDVRLVTRTRGERLLWVQCADFQS